MNEPITWTVGQQVLLSSPGGFSLRRYLEIMTIAKVTKYHVILEGRTTKFRHNGHAVGSGYHHPYIRPLKAGDPAQVQLQQLQDKAQRLAELLVKHNVLLSVPDVEQLEQFSTLAQQWLPQEPPT